VTAASRWNARQKGKSALSAGGKKRKCIRGKKENMNRKDELKRRIELKRQLIKLTEIEIEALNAELQKTGDRLITENRQPEPASIV
jgi:hypothetical protein